MNELVIIKANDIFTDSLVIAEGTNNKHRSVQRIIDTHLSSLEKFGRVRFEITPMSTKGGVQNVTLYQLNEQQATFLITLLRNNEKVVDFKIRLVQEFYRMRTALIERQTTEWLQTRENGKLVRRKETDALALLKIYAENQREGKPYKHIYTNYTKLVNEAVGIQTGEREFADYKKLQIISLIEDMIENTVLEEMESGVFFKEIYRKCQVKVNTFTSLMYLDNRKLISA